ncbi:MAG: hypothetical protein V4563_02050 [Pseudomonadota bacterium]
MPDGVQNYKLWRRTNSACRYLQPDLFRYKLKAPQTIHPHGNGVFKVDGETLKLPFKLR